MSLTLPFPAPTITDEAFDRFRNWIHAVAGIRLSDQKKALVMGRLAGRLRHHRLPSYEAYFSLLTEGSHPAEPQMALDLLTTNETHFFREPKHFDFLRAEVLPGRARGRMFRVWSAACSSGEEAYSIAMTLASDLGDSPWEVFASDVSLRMLERARAGHYPMGRAKGIPPGDLHEHCLRGVGPQDGTFIVQPSLAERVRFAQVNLNRDLPDVGAFDVVFLRNVMIYFDWATKREVVKRILDRMRAGGYLIVGHSESLNGVSSAVASVRPSIYRKA